MTPDSKRLLPIVLSDLCEQADRDEAERRARRQWGPWHLDTKSLELIYKDKRGRKRYFVDLERMNTSAQVLDWIFQLHKKSWCSTEDVGHLIAALDAIFDPQARLCSWAITAQRGYDGKRIDATAFLRWRYGAAGGGR